MAGYHEVSYKPPGGGKGPRKVTRHYDEDMFEIFQKIHWVSKRAAYVSVELFINYNSFVPAPGPAPYPGHGMDFPLFSITPQDKDVHLVHDTGYSDIVSGVSNVMNYARTRTWTTVCDKCQPHSDFAEIVPRLKFVMAPQPDGDGNPTSIDQTYGDLGGYTNVVWGYSIKVKTYRVLNVDPRSVAWADLQGKTYWILPPASQADFDSILYPTHDILGEGKNGTFNPGDYPYENGLPAAYQAKSIYEIGLDFRTGQNEYYGWGWSTGTRTSQDTDFA